VARAFGLPVAVLAIASDGSGQSSIGCAAHLPIAERLAVCAAGMEAVELLGARTHLQAGFSDQGKIIDLLEQRPGVSAIGSARKPTAGPVKSWKSTPRVTARFDSPCVGAGYGSGGPRSGATQPLGLTGCQLRPKGCHPALFCHQSLRNDIFNAVTATLLFYLSQCLDNEIFSAVTDTQRGHFSVS